MSSLDVISTPKYRICSAMDWTMIMMLLHLRSLKNGRCIADIFFYLALSFLGVFHFQEDHLWLNR